MAAHGISGNGGMHPGSELTLEQQAFGMAMHRAMQDSGIRFLSWSQVLDVAQALGYRRVAEATALPKFRRGKDNGDD